MSLRTALHSPPLFRRASPGIPIAIAAALALIIGGWVPSADGEQIALGGIVFAGAAVALITLTSWRAGVYLFLFWIVFEDLPRKFLGNDLRVFFGKDLLVAIAYSAFLLWANRQDDRVFRPPFSLPLLLFAGLGVAQILNPNAPTIFFGLAGLKVYFAYVPLMFLGYALNRSVRDVERFLCFNLAMAGVVAGIGIAQAIVGPKFLNPTDLPAQLKESLILTRRAPISSASVYRPSSVFVSDGRFAWFLLLMFLLGLGAIGFLVVNRRGGAQRFVVVVGIGLVMGAIGLSGSRGTLLYAAGSLVVLGTAFAWGAPRGIKHRARLLAGIRRVVIAGALVIVALVVLFPQALSARWAFYEETLAPWSPTSELAYRTTDYPVGNFLSAFEQPNWLLGNGTGMASLGVKYVVGLLGAEPPQIGVESGYGVLLLELGVLGPLLWLTWTVALVWFGWRIVRRLRGTSLFPVGLSILWFAFVLLFPLTYGGMQAYQNYVFNAYLWLLCGVLFRLPELAEREALQVDD